METLRWIAARVLFVMSLTFSWFVLVTVGGAKAEHASMQVLGFALVSVLCYAGFLACWFTSERRRGA